MGAFCVWEIAELWEFSEVCSQKALRMEEASSSAVARGRHSGLSLPLKPAEQSI
jgi:hypothetical protein